MEDFRPEIVILEPALQARCIDPIGGAQPCRGRVEKGPEKVAPTALAKFRPTKHRLIHGGPTFSSITI